MGNDESCVLWGIFMKKILCMLCVAVLCAVGITACGESTELMLSASAEGNPGLQIVEKVYAKEYRSEDGRVLLGNYSYETPLMSGVPEDPVSESAMDAFNAGMTTWVEERIENWDEAMENAQAWYDESRKDEWEYYGHWRDETTCQMNETEEMVSIRFLNYVYSGGAHGYSYYSGMLFDKRNGVFVELEAMTDDMDGLAQAVSGEILRQIEEQELDAEFGYWTDYDQSVAQWNVHHNVFFNENNDMEIIFPAYELASYAAGAQFFSVEQDVYEPYLNENGKRLLMIAESE